MFGGVYDFSGVIKIFKDFSIDNFLIIYSRKILVSFSKKSGKSSVPPQSEIPQNHAFMPVEKRAKIGVPIYTKKGLNKWLSSITQDPPFNISEYEKI